VTHITAFIKAASHLHGEFEGDTGKPPRI